MRSFNSGASRPTPLGQLLAPKQNKIQPQLGLGPPHADTSFVGPRQNLPGAIPYGSLAPKPLEANRYTGGRVASPAQGLVQGAPPTPNLSPGGGMHGGAIAPALAALGLLTGTPHGGAATGPVPQPPGATGATPGGPPLITNGKPGDALRPPIHSTDAITSPFPVWGNGDAVNQQVASTDNVNQQVIGSPIAQALAALLANSGIRPNPSHGVYFE